MATNEKPATPLQNVNARDGNDSIRTGRSSGRIKSSKGVMGMARTSKSPKKFIVSCRVSDREMRTIHQRAQESGLSITMLLRKSLDLAAKEGLSA